MDPTVSLGRFLLRSVQALARPLWTPERDEKVFLGALAVAVFALRSEGALPIAALAVAGWIGYVMLFWKRLRGRCELKTFLIASAVVFSVLLGVGLAAVLV